MACSYVKRKDNGGIVRCSSPYYSGGNINQIVSNTMAKQYCYGNYEKCPDFNYNNSKDNGLKTDRETFKNNKNRDRIAIAIVIFIGYIIYKTYM